MLWIIDDFKTNGPFSHGNRVERSTQYVAGSNGENVSIQTGIFDLGKSLIDGFDPFIQGIQAGLRQPEVHAMNISFSGFGDVSIPAFGLSWFIDESLTLDTRWFDQAKQLFDQNITLVLSSGNYTNTSNLSSASFEVSRLASTGFNLVAASGEYDGQTWRVADYSKLSPALVDYVLEGFADEEKTAFGTSFAAPRLAGAIEAVHQHFKEKGQTLTQSEVYSFLEENAQYFSYNKGVQSPVNKGEKIYQGLDVGALDFDNFVPDKLSSKLLVSSLYEVVLNRHPDPEGFKFWEQKVKQMLENQSNEGMDIKPFYEAFLSSQEFENKKFNSTNDEVPLMQRVQGLVHLTQLRQSTDEQLSTWTSYALEKTAEKYQAHPEYIFLGQYVSSGFGQILEDFVQTVGIKSGIDLAPLYDV